MSDPEPSVPAMSVPSLLFMTDLEERLVRASDSTERMAAVARLDNLERQMKGDRSRGITPQGFEAAEKVIQAAIVARAIVRQLGRIA